MKASSLPPPLQEYELPVIWGDTCLFPTASLLLAQFLELGNSQTSPFLDEMVL